MPNASLLIPAELQSSLNTRRLYGSHAGDRAGMDEEAETLGERACVCKEERKRRMHRNDLYVLSQYLKR